MTNAKHSAKRFLPIFLFCVLPWMLMAQQVTNARFYQEGKKVVVTYTIDKTASLVHLEISTDGGASYRTIGRGLSGDVGSGIAAGSKRIVYDVLADVDKLQGDRICFKVVANFSTTSRTFTVGGVTFDMVFVQGGMFTMGCTAGQGGDCYYSEEPAHSVTLSDYYIGKTEVTQALWQAVMGSNPSSFKGDNRSVESVSWNDCQEFIRKLNAMTGKTFALPTEAQWEYAVRGGNKSRDCKYSGSNNISDVAWYMDNSSSQTHNVGTKQPNELGLYDMSGNVWEWCSDWYGSYSSVLQTNPVGASTGFYRVNRGGSWGYGTGYCRVSYRGSNNLDYGSYNIGLRLALVQ